MLYPSTYLRSVGLDRSCALITDGRFSGGSSGLSVGHISPEAAEAGVVGLVEDGDVIRIDIADRRIELAVDEEELGRRRTALDARCGPTWRPGERYRPVSRALALYGRTAASASKGAVRDLSLIR